MRSEEFDHTLQVVVGAPWTERDDLEALVPWCERHKCAGLTPCEHKLFPHTSRTNRAYALLIEPRGCVPIGLPHSDASATPTSGLPPARWC